MKSPKEIAEKAVLKGLGMGNRKFDAEAIFHAFGIGERMVSAISEAVQHERDEAEKKLDRIREAVVKNDWRISKEEHRNADTNDALSAFDSARNEK